MGELDFGNTVFLRDTQAMPGRVIDEKEKNNEVVRGSKKEFETEKGLKVISYEYRYGPERINSVVLDGWFVFVTDTLGNLVGYVSGAIYKDDYKKKNIGMTSNILSRFTGKGVGFLMEKINNKYFQDWVNNNGQELIREEDDNNIRTIEMFRNNNEFSDELLNKQRDRWKSIYGERNGFKLVNGVLTKIYSPGEEVVLHYISEDVNGLSFGYWGRKISELLDKNQKRNS